MIAATEPSDNSGNTTDTPQRQPGISTAELTALLAFLSACTALSIDAVLPTFSDVREAFGLGTNSTAPALILSSFFFGLAGGQLIWGSIADRFGRLPTLKAGFVLFALGSIGATLSPSMAIMIPSRFIWGFGASAARGMSIAITRDLFEGDALSKMMSRVQSIFMLAPILAPSLGAAMLWVLPWRSVYATGAVFAAIGWLWTRRLNETLDPSNRRGLDLSSLGRAFAEVVRVRPTMWFALALTLHYAAFFPYLGSAELIFDRMYGLDEIFPILFGAAGLAMGISSAVTSKSVDRIGTERTMHGAMVGYALTSVSFLTIGLMTSGQPPFVLMYVLLTCVLIFHLPLSPIYNSEAMQPVGHVAGTAASVIGTMSLGIGTAIGTPVTNAITSSINPLALGFVVFGGLGMACALMGLRAMRRHSNSTPAHSI